jgi:hypothetical protein
MMKQGREVTEIVEVVVARDGVEPPTPVFSGLRSIGLTTFSINKLNSSRWPIYCDHSVTSADVRLSVGFAMKSTMRDPLTEFWSAQRLL